MRQSPICLLGWNLSEISNPGFVSCSTYKADTDIRGRSFLLPHFFSCDLALEIYMKSVFAKVLNLHFAGFVSLLLFCMVSDFLHF